MATASHDTSIEDLLRQSPNIPQRPTASSACCCGRVECAYLLHNNAALDDLEKNVHTAAQLGQVCIPSVLLVDCYLGYPPLPFLLYCEKI